MRICGNDLLFQNDKSDDFYKYSRITCLIGYYQNCWNKNQIDNPYKSKILYLLLMLEDDESISLRI